MAGHITDGDSYPQWHPLVLHASGRLAVGARQREVVRTATGRQMTFRPVLTTVTPERELTRRGRLLAPGVFTGEHSYLIEPLDSTRVRVTQSERLTGVLVPLLRRRLATETQHQFRVALEGLARQINTRRSAPPRPADQRLAGTSGRRRPHTNDSSSPR
ncbi:SRPBCC domain-containing protein [Frankia sp. ACN1ag]|uniref:SRPBCC domain-containing protein n=1 Tax=Frankia sp. ACN1ag TaxID=102891 RepID=UPI0006DBF416|nr:SRPBCC domain-containing protein [Frankia sp. ACN1ag]